MKVIKYRIRNYKAIEDVTIKLNYSINPIIGVNESGKTSILQGILAFDKNRDRVNSGKHLDFQNKYSTKPTKDSKISAYIKLTKSELKSMLENLSLSSGSENYRNFQKLSENSEIIITRILSSELKEHVLEGDLFDDKISKKVIKYIQGIFPFILYFDDFTDRVPDEIRFPDDYKTTGKLPSSRQREWQEIIEEIFNRSEAEGIEEEEIPLVYFLQLNKEDRRDDILSDIQDVLNKEIIEEWKKIKRSGHSNLADDSENLSIQLKFEDDLFVFKVKDTSNKDKRRTFNVSERSKGFQWFFNYMIKLKFNPRYKGAKENSIFLLDEPGSYLHSSAQIELLKELKSVSEKNTIIYCTHSQFLLNPKIIRLGSIKIAEKVSAKITLTDFGNYKDTGDKGALSAVYQALRLNYSNDFVGKLVITEGITDLYFFQMLNKYTTCFKKKFNIIPGSGSGNQSNLISVGISFSEDFVVLFDNDAGAKAIKKYIDEFGEEITKHFHLYNAEVKFKLENFLEKEDKDILLKITGTKHLKKAFAILYYDHKESEQKDFFCNLRTKTMDRLSSTIERINSLN